MTQNNDFSIPDTHQQDSPSSQLDIYDEAIQSNVNDELLDDLNLGLGNYSSAEYWQQVESFSNGVYAQEAFERRLTGRAIQETKRKLALEGYRFWDERKEEYKSWDGWDDLDEDEKQEKSRTRYVDECGERIWNGLSDERKLDAVVELTGFDGFTPIHFRMMMMRHEGSRSKNARLLDNLFGRVKEVKDETSEIAKQRLQR